MSNDTERKASAVQRPADETSPKRAVLAAHEADALDRWIASRRLTETQRSTQSEETKS